MNDYDYFKLNEDYYQPLGSLTSPIGSSLRPDTLTRVVELARRMDPSPYPKKSQNYLVFDGSPADLTYQVVTWLYDELDMVRLTICGIGDGISFCEGHNAFMEQKARANLRCATEHESQLLQLIRMLGA